MLVVYIDFSVERGSLEVRLPEKEKTPLQSREMRQPLYSPVPEFHKMKSLARQTSPPLFHIFSSGYMVSTTLTLSLFHWFTISFVSISPNQAPTLTGLKSGSEGARSNGPYLYSFYNLRRNCETRVCLAERHPNSAVCKPF